jgi:hypothetical protein
MITMDTMWEALLAASHPPEGARHYTPVVAVTMITMDTMWEALLAASHPPEGARHYTPVAVPVPVAAAVVDCFIVEVEAAVETESATLDTRPLATLVLVKAPLVWGSEEGGLRNDLW